ncbi:uncharacterized protein LOC124839551 [Vigna umbellata]|uniref:uncharacterized protein LOC124839551 n=1 Tax=Vigna umbellata TaxID=87088 RepID=UPI001F5E63E6|nr:uncharacterized protein LOC124839551 [Vigna umbellata]XP_047171356.1 uncharacterized protein LOC124839551 [Vigna umbellata]XP_047171357.1 uncharacterized protein LOC124839551 [Vigna umbellata]
MMARFISKSKTLLRHSQSPKVLIVCHRHRSSEAMKSKWVEIEGVKLLEDHAHRVMVMKATPDWLPFLPGSSFWVPPPPSPFLPKFSIPTQPFLLQAVATPRGTELTVQLKVMAPTENVALSEDEEG